MTDEQNIDEIAVGDAQLGISPFGAHVTRWSDAVTGDVIFLSSAASFGAGKAIRGGIPICFPWFADGPSGSLRPAHGFARTATWRSMPTDADRSDSSRRIYELTSSDVAQAPGRDVFGYEFEASYDVDPTPEQLRVTLTVRNTDQRAFDFEAALHTYLLVGDVHQVAIDGLADTPYADKVTGSDSPGAPGPLRIAGETDRVYRASGDIVVTDPSLGRRIRVSSSGAQSTVVWNPGEAKATGMADLGEGQWRTFVCVETANVSPGVVHLGPGDQHAMSATITTEPVHRTTADAK